eukprot:TRINITY_DN61119_c0_g1_i1.p1 TRINITY_DN61119_c0_g1~~TRINITY_DN61119_c0_g1_i1.p1  ORF type:complete len:742 (+),score=118.25 TRINITY_DN61119_c0_g1_i1:76-2226(+)
MPLSREHAVAWVNAYGEAWKAQAADKILRLYTEDAVYIERPYDPEGGIYRGHTGIREYWETHISKREKDIDFRQIEEDLAYDPDTCTATAKWEARFSVRQRSSAGWKGVQFLQVAMLRFAPDGRVRHFEEWWHARHLQRAAKGLRDPKARRPRAGPKRRLPEMGGRTSAHSALLGASLGPFEREAIKMKAKNASKLQAKALPKAPKVSGSADHEVHRSEVLHTQGKEENNLVVALLRQAVGAKAPAGVLPPPRSSGLINWYRQAILKAELMEESDISGVPMLRPRGAFLWEELRRWLDAELEAFGMMPFLPPVLAHHPEEDTPESMGERHKSFLEVRTSSEVLLYNALAKHWIKSTRDLPLLLKRWGVAVSPETVRQPLPFLRSQELPWQEGHAVHADALEAASFATAVQGVYVRLCEELLAVVPCVREVPVSLGVAADKDACAESHPDCDSEPVKVVIEVPVPNPGRSAGDAASSVEVASVHQLGSSTAAAFNLSYATTGSQGKQVNRNPFQTCFSVTCRALGAALCAHGDDRGLVLPPQLAPFQVVLIPIVRYTERKSHGVTEGGELAEHVRWCESVAALLRSPLVDAGAAGVNSRWAASPLRVHIDGRGDATPSKKLRSWFVRGTPLLLTVKLDSEPTAIEGEQVHTELKAALVNVVARDACESEQYSARSLTTRELAQITRCELVELHKRLFERHRKSVEASAPKADARSEM